MRHGAGCLARCEANKGKEGKQNAGPNTDFKACFFAKKACWCGRPLHYAGRQQAASLAGCWMAVHRKLAGVDDLYTAWYPVTNQKQRYSTAERHEKLR